MTSENPVFTAAEVAYLTGQRLGRLATLKRGGRLQNNPVGFRLREDGTIDIRGRNLGASAKFGNVRRHAQVALVVDDLASVSPWVVRCVEIRGRAEAVEGIPATGYFSGEVIRVIPEQVISFGLPGERWSNRRV